MRSLRRPLSAGRRLFLGTTAALSLACGSGSELTAPTTGAVEVTTSTAGEDPDPDGYTLTLDGAGVEPIGPVATATLTDLAPGTHRVGLVGIAANCAVAGGSARAVTIVAGEVAGVDFSIECGALPPPTGTVAVTTVTSGPNPDPDGYAFAVGGGAPQPIGSGATVRLAGVEAGATTVELSGVAANCTVAGDNPRPVTVVAGGEVEVDFAIACVTGTGTLEVTTATSGAPVDPSGYTLSVDGGTAVAIGVSATRTIGGLAPGGHSVALGGVAGNCAVEGQNPRAVTIVESQTTTVAFAVQCSATTGSLAVTVAGLPAGVNAAVTVTGPGGYSEQVTATGVLDGLEPGPYAVSAGDVGSGGTTYQPSPRNRNVAVEAGATARVTITYAAVSGGSLNLRIAGVNLTQSIQSFDNAVALVAGRDALLRVVAQANESNTATPAVRVRLYDGGSLVQTILIPAPADTVPTGRSDRDLGTTWNVLVPGARIRSGLAILADVDPADLIPETDETDNTYPSESPLSLAVLAAPPLSVTLVPVRQSANQLQGDVTNANRDQYLDLSQRIYPLPGYDAGVHPVYTTTTSGPLQADNANGAWNTILNELAALRIAENSDRHYYGVVRIDYLSGLAGIGFVGLPIAMGYDHPTDRGRIVAHELGHTWGRRHAPCGSPGDVDRDFPYPGGTIGKIGYDVEAGVTKPRSTPDVMGYCDNPWISDYTYQAVMAVRGTALGLAPDIRARPSLLVWGRIVNGRAVIEPAFHLVTRPVVPSRPGAFSIEGTAADGSRVFGLSFDPIEAADDERRAKHFAFAVPLDRQGAGRLEAIRLTGPGIGMVAMSASPASLRATPAKPVSVVPAAAGVAVGWDDAVHPMVMVRDPRSGAVLSFARGGNVVVPAAGPEVELIMSDGVRSSAVVVPARR
jgi:hypothetical protein